MSSLLCLHRLVAESSSGCNEHRSVAYTRVPAESGWARPRHPHHATGRPPSFSRLALVEKVVSYRPPGKPEKGKLKTIK